MSGNHRCSKPAAGEYKFRGKSHNVVINPSVHRKSMSVQCYSKPDLKEELRLEIVTGVYNVTVWINISAYIVVFSFNYGRLSQAFVCKMSNLCGCWGCVVNDFPRAQINLVPCLPHLAPRTVYFNQGNMTLNSNPNSIITRGLRSHPFKLWHNKIWTGLKPGRGCVQFVLAVVLRIWSVWLCGMSQVKWVCAWHHSDGMKPWKPQD